MPDRHRHRHILPSAASPPATSRQAPAQTAESLLRGQETLTVELVQKRKSRDTSPVGDSEREEKDRVTVTSFQENERPTPGIRLLMGLFAAGMIAVFAVACWLQPDPRGFGTHLQLGLPPCQFMELTGMHCPHCGMTTSFSHFVRGNFSEAWSANPCGVLLAIVCGFCMPWALAVSSTGRWILTKQPFHWFIFGAIGYVFFAFSIWILRSFVF